MIIVINVWKSGDNYYASSEINGGTTISCNKKEDAIEFVKNDCKKTFGSGISFSIEENEPKWFCD